MDFTHEVIADIPLMIGFMNRLNLGSLLDKHLPSHGNHKGLSNGHLVMGWITHILTQNNHCKAPIQEWALNHTQTLQALFKNEINRTDFDDCRLGRLLGRFSKDDFWHTFEESFYKNSFSILELNTTAPEDFKEGFSTKQAITKTIKLDSTTAYGHHEVTEGGIMQRGFSKDHRSDLPQLKIMAAVEGNTGIQIASEIVPGNRPDDPLYIPIMERTRKIINTTNSLICGDCKMSALEIRANMVKNKEYYLTPLPASHGKKTFFDDLVENIVAGDRNADLIWDIDEKGHHTLIGAGYEISRTQSYQKEDSVVEWLERVLVVRSTDYANQGMKKLKSGINKKKEEIKKEKSNLFNTLEEAQDWGIKLIKEHSSYNKIEGFFDIKVEIIAEEKVCKRAEKRSGKVRNGTYKIKKYRSAVSEVIENESIIKELSLRMGWRLYATNADKEILTFSKAYRWFRKTMYVIEIGFHDLKDYINICPLFVRKEEQILGLTRLLMLALKILTLMTAEIRSNMKKENLMLKGLYAGQSARTHPSPTAQSILKYFSRQEIAIVGYCHNKEWHWSITPLSELCQSALKLLGVPLDCYTSLPELFKSYAQATMTMG